MNMMVPTFEDLGFLGYWSWDTTTDRVEASTRVNCLFGIDADGHALEMADYEMRIHPDDREWLRSERVRSVGPSGWGVVEYRMIDPEGEIHWLMCRAIYELDEDGAIAKAHGMVLDVTAFKRDANACRTAPSPLPDPIQSLADAALAAYGAAQQVGNPIVLRQAEEMLVTSGKLLAFSLVKPDELRVQ